MAKQIQLRRGTTAENNGFTGAVGEVSVDTDKDVLVVHDGVTTGGFPVAARANANGTISLIKKDGTSAGSINATGLFDNTLTSTTTDQALTAAQGKVLKDLADTKLTTTSAFGVGQTWQDVTSIRVWGTTYTNSTTKPITVIVKYGQVNFEGITVYVSGIGLGLVRNNVQGSNAVTVVVPSGDTYMVSGGNSKEKWLELR